LSLWHRENPGRIQVHPAASGADSRGGSRGLFSCDRQCINALDDDEMRRLVSLVVEEFGPALARTRFNDVMLGLFEHIAAPGDDSDDNCSSVPRYSPVEVPRKPQRKIKLAADLIPLAIPTRIAARPSPVLYHYRCADALNCRKPAVSEPASADRQGVSPVTRADRARDCWLTGRYELRLTSLQAVHAEVAENTVSIYYGDLNVCFRPEARIAV
jgi:hypothetical protein